VFRVQKWNTWNGLYPPLFTVGCVSAANFFGDLLKLQQSYDVAMIRMINTIGIFEHP